VKRIAFLFPGQGSQYKGMGKHLYENFSAARECFEEAGDALGMDLKSLCFEGDVKELTKTENTQPALLTCSVATYRVFSNEIAKPPLYFAGHSLGEVSALTCAGGIAFHDAVKIVRKRGELMSRAVSPGLGIMAAILGVDSHLVEEVCEDISSDECFSVVANYNSPLQTVISGHVRTVEKAGVMLEKMGAKVVFLNVSAPFHSPLMKQTVNAFKEELLKYDYCDFRYPVLSNVDATPYFNASAIIDNLLNQLVMPVRWGDTINFLKERGIDMAIELGPGNILTKLTKQCVSDISSYSVDTGTDLMNLKEVIKDWENPEIIQVNGSVITKSLAIAVCTQNRNDNEEEYYEYAVKPYKKIQQLEESLLAEKQEPTKDHVKDALDMLKSVFDGKKVPVSEQIERYNQLYDQTDLRNFINNFCIQDLIAISRI
jgi:[acyl-carrier-protein] S-malonyltransferase